VLVLVVLGLALLVPVAIWSFEGSRMRGDFIRVLRSGSVDLPLELRDKSWTERELAGVEVLRVAGGSGKEQAVSRTIHDRGRVVVSSHQYGYQGTIKDDATGIVHVFGYSRSGSPGWRWVSIHPSSAKLHIDRQMRQLEQMKQQWEAEKTATPRRPASPGRSQTPP
jgi:hypothetical protein